MNKNLSSLPSTSAQLFNLSEKGLDRLREAIEPKDLPDHVVTEGDLDHKHDFHMMQWDSKRLGPDLCDFDKDPGTEIAFPMVTYKDLYVCSCGREVVRSKRALI